MLGRVVVENGVKKIVPLTADCGSGNPVGTVIAVYSNKVPNGYLPCNGVTFDTAQFPVLYALLGDDHTPDLRECTLVGIGQSDRTMGAHDVYTVGQFKDDQSQKITGSYNATGAFGSIGGAFVQTSDFEYANGVSRSGVQWSSINFDSSNVVRTGTTTHGKQVGVNWCIKATSGINENQADNVLSALSPVNEVTADNLHSVTSNAVALFLSGYLRFETVESESFTINAGASLDVAVTIPQIDGYSIGIVFYYRNQNSNALYSGKYILNTGTTSGTAWMYNPTNANITTKIEVIVMYIKNL